MDLFFSGLGILGSIFCIGMFFMIGRGYIKPHNPWHYIINGLGGGFILIATLYSFDGGDVGAIVQESCWVAISILGLIKILKVKQDVRN